MSDIEFNSGNIEILLIMLGFDLYEAHGEDMITIHMLKFAMNQFVSTEQYFFRESLNNESFTPEWKKDNVVPFQKMMINTYLKSYWRHCYSQNM